MADEEVMKKIEDIQAELRYLHSDLQFSDDYGDWKIVKTQEYRLLGKDDPYDLEELAYKRQVVRDRINELEEQLKDLM